MRFAPTSTYPVAIALGHALRAVVRVVRRLVDHREHFTGTHVEHDDRSGLGAVSLHRCLERPVRKVLDAQVDAELQVLAVMRRLDTRDVFD